MVCMKCGKEIGTWDSHIADVTPDDVTFTETGLIEGICGCDIMLCMDCGKKMKEEWLNKGGKKLDMKINKVNARDILEGINTVAGEGLLSDVLQEFGMKLKMKFFPEMKEDWWERSIGGLRTVTMSVEEYREKRQKIKKQLEEGGGLE